MMNLICCNFPSRMARITVAPRGKDRPQQKFLPACMLNIISDHNAFSSSFQSGVVDWIIGLGDCPTASITVCTSIINFGSLDGIGFRRPDSSGSPSSIFWHSMPQTRPFSSPIIRVGFVSIIKLDAFFLCMMDFFQPRRHFFAGAAINQICMLSSKAFRSTYRIHCRIPAPITATPFPILIGVSYSGIYTLSLD